MDKQSKSIRHLGFLPLLLLVSGICIAQEPEVEVEAVAEVESVEGQEVAVDVYSTLVIGRPELIIEGLDPIPIDAQLPLEEIETEAFQANNQTMLDSIRQYQASIDEREFEGGAWDQGLTQELRAMGSLQLQQGAYLQAIEAYTRAMQVSRINYGLDNIEQVPVVEQLINSHLALGQWGKADQYHNYLYYTQKKAFGLDDPRMIPVLDRLASWSMSVFNSGYGEAVGLRLLTAFSSYRAASEIVSLHFGEEDERYVNYLKDMAATAYLVSRNQSLIEEANRPEYSNSQAMFEDKMREIDAINPSGYNDGLRALERIVDHFADEDDLPSDYAQALIGLGDWHLMFERRRTSARYYQEAYEVLGALDQGDKLIQEYLGRVKPLPELSQTIQPLSVDTVSDGDQARASYSGAVDVIFDVTRYGAVIKLRMLTEETEVNSTVLTLLRRRIRNTVFRPAVVDGELTRTPDNHFRYRYWY
jgi:tetratricopeptide (TPR) repeat protein